MTEAEKQAAIIAWATKQITLVETRSLDELATARAGFEPLREAIRGSKLPPGLIEALDGVFNMAFTTGATIGATGMLAHLSENCGQIMAQAIGLTAIADNGPLANKIQRFKKILSTPSGRQPS